MTEKRYKRLVSSIDYYYCTDNQNENQGLTEKDMLDRLNEQDERIETLKEENEQLKQLLDLFASDICKVTELLDDNNIEYELYNDVENFIVKWGVRIE
jgi:cell shape-determining protein MreC